MKEKWISIGIIFIFLIIGIGSFGFWPSSNDSDEFNFCLDVVYNGITNDPEVMSYCQKVIDDSRAERNLEERERNEKFLKEFGKND